MLWCPGPCQGSSCLPAYPSKTSSVDNRGKNDRPTRNTGRSNPSPELSPQITPYLHTLLFPGSAPNETGIALLTSGSSSSRASGSRSSTSGPTPVISAALGR
ncbi:hypothetical protein QC762_0093560 [Podospora pseudocomata]|uniref:Uncharacterized protein n=1 Tax=Podospora pseudocomata TaxID=2093779 RepID=A0ABR0G6Y6_9PEZI|nr:hypothetical protein QC762_0093560 [Podospora pseudocomata]